ncbi:MAG: Co2+/Mg2+ efflux protein ApaG [Bacteroidota bacterium]
MIHQVTKGIKISVQTNYEGNRFQDFRLYYTFSYRITIENQSNDSVQLISRHWDIFDSLNDLDIVEGEGVIGKKPIIPPKGVYTYNSHCFLTSPIGAMSGYFNMFNFITTKQFKVQIPTFQLLAPATLN